MLYDADGIGGADLGEAIEDCSPDFELGYLTTEGAGHDALTEQFETVHFCLGKAAAVIAAPFLPDRSDQSPYGA